MRVLAFAIAALLGACQAPEGELRRGLVISWPQPQFIAVADGQVYELPAEAAGLAQEGRPQCVVLDSSVAPSRPGNWAGHRELVVHRVVSTQRKDACRFRVQRYRGYLYMPTEGLYFFTQPPRTDAGDENWREAWFPVNVHHEPWFGVNARWSQQLQNERRACVEVEGVPSQEGWFNHLGSSRRQLTVLRVIRVWRPPDLPAEVSARYRPFGPQVFPEHVASCQSEEP